MDFAQLQLPSSLVATLLVAALWTVYTLVHRLFRHPLAKFPGPTLAKITYWYEFYYDVILDGQYTFKLKQLHEQYGPVLRLNPDELHIIDPEYYDEVFNASKNVEKPYKEANMFGPYPAAIGTVGHDLHRIRRGALNPFFSKRSVYELVPFVEKIIENICYRFESAALTGEPVNLKYAYAALTMDIMNEYCFSENPDRTKVGDFDQASFDKIDEFVHVSLANYHLPWLMNMIHAMPQPVIEFLFPGMSGTLDFRLQISDQVEAIRAGEDVSYEESGHRTILHELLESKLPSSEMGKDRLRDEAFSLVTAGAGTSSHTLKTTSYHICANQHVQTKLHQELLTVMPRPEAHVDLQVLEKLPYLTAVIHEGLRIGHAVTHRLSRAFPDKTLQYGGLAIPPRTVVHMTSMLIHENEDIFPEPYIFKPERWLGSDQQRLQKYLTPFSRGTRSCLGVNLAWAEQYLIIAHVFRRFSFDVSGVVRERDIDCVRDMGVGMPTTKSKGVVVKVVPVED